MDKQLFSGKVDATIKRRNLRFVGRFWLWLGLQVGWGIGCVLFVVLVRPHSFWKFMLVQWAGILAIWYGQVYAAQLRGLDIYFETDEFDTWDVIKAEPWDLRFLIFKKRYPVEGGVFCRCYPFYLSKKRWATLAKGYCFRLLIGLKLIQ